jgi:hypothetical protein
MAGGTVYPLSPTAANYCAAFNGRAAAGKSIIVFVFEPVSTTTTVIIYYYYYYNDSDKDATRWRQHNIKYIYNIIGIVASGEKSLSRAILLRWPSRAAVIIHCLFFSLSRKTATVTLYYTKFSDVVETSIRFSRARVKFFNLKKLKSFYVKTETPAA